MQHRAHHHDAEHPPSTPMAQQKTLRRNADGILLTSCGGRERETEIERGCEKREKVGRNVSQKQTSSTTWSISTHTHSVYQIRDGIKALPHAADRTGKCFPLFSCRYCTLYINNDSLCFQSYEDVDIPTSMRS